MPFAELDLLAAEIRESQLIHTVGRVTEVSASVLQVAGLSESASVGDAVVISADHGAPIEGEILNVNKERVCVLLNDRANGVLIGDRVRHLGAEKIAPAIHWIGRVIDPSGRPLDGRTLAKGQERRSLNGSPPPPTQRKPLGNRLETGLAAFNTVLPIVRGQRIGLFSGSGVGKSTLLSSFAKGLQADVVVIALIGERGREVQEFIEKTLGPDGMSKSVLIAATSDQSPLTRRKCIQTAMTVAEFFRDLGLQVLLLADSITRFAEAHREVALAAGEAASLRGFPPTTAHTIMSLCERAGPGNATAGDITAIFTVLVAGSNMEEPIADMMRGVLDGHVILDREIAERGRFPAVNLLRSVSRSLPHAANENENKLISKTRQLLGAYERSEAMIQAGLYSAGTDAIIDEAIAKWTELDQFIGSTSAASINKDFERLRGLLEDAN